MYVGVRMYRQIDRSHLDPSVNQLDMPSICTIRGL